MQKLIRWSEYYSRQARAIELTLYIKICKSWLSDQSSEYHPREIRASGPTVYIRNSIVKYILMRNAIKSYKKHLLAK